MSTILDALRKVQSERQPRDLRESVLGGAVEGTEPRDRRFLWIALAVLLLFAMPVSAWFVWPGGEQLMAALPELPIGDGADVPPATAQSAPTPKAMQVAKANLPMPARPDARSVDRKAARLAAQEKARAQAIASAEAEAAAMAAAHTPPAPELRSVGPPQASAGANAPRAPVRQAKAASAPTPAPPARPARRVPPVAEPAPAEPAPAKPRPELDMSVKLEPLRSAELESAESSDPFGAGDVHQIAFPNLSVEAVRWHPEPERRVARILLDGTRPVEAREGDIVAGVAIQRIDPGAVEMRLGDLRALLKPGQ